MKPQFEQSHLGMPRVLAVLVLGMLSAGHAAAQLAAEPQRLVFRDYDQVETVRLTAAGQPISLANIRSHAVHLGDRIFNDFFTIEKADGQVTITPTREVEIGRFQIFIHTRHGSVMVEVYTPLDQAPDSLESRAREKGITVEELRREMGLVTPTGRENIRIELAPTYYQGQTLRVNVDAKPGRTYSWRVNGEVVAEGADAHSLNYTFQQPGEHEIHYTERSAETGGTIASTTATTNVLARPAG